MRMLIQLPRKIKIILNIVNFKHWINYFSFKHWIKLHAQLKIFRIINVLNVCCHFNIQ